ncbi:hypothetical protein L8106_24360 [Lyngbya sp. PCC 8106]|nr:hypothetical protein L8106_24360 [Lyngbya sp. PCC 8106]
MKDFNRRKNGGYSNKKSFVNDIAPPSPQGRFVALKLDLLGGGEVGRWGGREDFY